MEIVLKRGFLAAAALLLFASITTTKAEVDQLHVEDLLSRTVEIKSNASKIIAGKAAKARAFESLRVAYFETFSGAPALRVYKPFEYSCVAIEYGKNMAKLHPVKKTTINVFANLITEEFYTSDKKRGLQNITRSNNALPKLDDFASVYAEGIPMQFKLRNEMDLDAVREHLVENLERAGITPEYEKPLLVLFIGGRNFTGTLSDENEAFIRAYFNRVSLLDETTKGFFHSSQKNMVEAIRDVYACPPDAKTYLSDGVLGGITRKLNMEYGDMKASKVLPKMAKLILASLVIGVVAKPVKDTFTNFYNSRINKKLPEWARDKKAE